MMDKTKGAQISQAGEILLGQPIEPTVGEFLRFDLLVGLVSVPGLLWVNPDYADRLLILTNGAVAREGSKSPLEVFQRRTWADQFKANALFLSDATIRPENTLRIGWGQGSYGAYALPAMAQAAQYVAQTFDIPSEKRLYYGSSAGGFQALQLAARDEGAQVLVNNPQVDWTRYIGNFPKRVAEYAFGTGDLGEVRERWPDRVSAARAMEEFGHVPRTRFLVNAASSNDIKIQLPAFMGRMDSFGRDMGSKDIDISVYYNEALGHMPLPKPRTLVEIDRCLAERS